MIEILSETTGESGYRPRTVRPGGRGFSVNVAKLNRQKLLGQLERRQHAYCSNQAKAAHKRQRVARTLVPRYSRARYRVENLLPYTAEKSSVKNRNFG